VMSSNMSMYKIFAHIPFQIAFFIESNVIPGCRSFPKQLDNLRDGFKRRIVDLVAVENN